MGVGLQFRAPEIGSGVNAFHGRSLVMSIRAHWLTGINAEYELSSRRSNSLPHKINRDPAMVDPTKIISPTYARGQRRVERDCRRVPAFRKCGCDAFRRCDG